MTGLVQSTTVAESSVNGEVSDSTEPIPLTLPDSDRSFAVEGRRPRAWMACGVVGLLLITWFILFSPGELGTKAEWFFGAGVFCLALVSLWQTFAVQRQANREMADARDRLRTELAANDERFIRELAKARSLHRAELAAQHTLHRAELTAQRELAQAERANLVRQLDKHAVTEVSRAVGAHTRMLATLWNQGAAILCLEDRDAREAAMAPVFEQITQVVNDFAVELGNAYASITDERLHRALDAVNEAVLLAVGVAEDVHRAVVDGTVPEPNPVAPMQQLLHQRSAEARSLAWNLLRTNLENGSAPAG